MTDESLNELLARCREWLRRCDDHNELQQAQEKIAQLLAAARSRLRIQPRGIGVFEGLVQACEEWIEGCDDPKVKRNARLLAQRKFNVPVGDYPTMHARLAECEEWIAKLVLEDAEGAIEALGYWLNEVGGRVADRRAEFDRSISRHEEGTYTKRPIPHNPLSTPRDPIEGFDEDTYDAYREELYDKDEAARHMELWDWTEGPDEDEATPY